MGTMTDAMQSGVDEIRSSREGLSAVRRELGDGSRSHLAEVRTARRNTSAAFRRARSSEREMRASANRDWREETGRARKEQTCGFREGVRQSLEELAVSVSETRSEAHNCLKRYALERSGAASALRERLSSERDEWSAQDMARREDAQRLREDIRRSLGELAVRVSDLRAGTRSLLEGHREVLDETASDLREAQGVWRRRWVREALRAVPPAVAPPPPGVKEVKAAPATAEERVLAVVRSHPEGAGLVDIGNELGVNWRTLIGPVKDLTDRGRIEKIEKAYHPVD